jgi:hypothetical protein
MFLNKRITAGAVCLMIITILLILPPAAQAAGSGEHFDFLLSVNGGGSVTVKVGDVVTVRASLRQTDANAITMFAVTDSIIFSNEFFELVPDSLVSVDTVVCSTEQMSGNWDGWTGISAGAFSSKIDGETWKNPTAMYTFKLKTRKLGTSVILHREHSMSTTTGLDEYESSATNATVIIKESDAPAFRDVDGGAWYYDAVRFVSARGIIVGDENGNFSPQSNLTRAQLAMILYRMAQMPDANGGAAFSDVERGAWYFDAVKWASSKEIIRGENGNFRPNDNVTREEFSVMLWRYSEQPQVSGSLTAFPDNATVYEWARDALAWAVGANIISGSDGKLLPQNEASRAQAAQMLYNYLG